MEFMENIMPELGAIFREKGTITDADLVELDAVGVHSCVHSWHKHHGTTRDGSVLNHQRLVVMTPKVMTRVLNQAARKEAEGGARTAKEVKFAVNRQATKAFPR